MVRNYNAFSRSESFTLYLYLASALSFYVSDRSFVQFPTQFASNIHIWTISVDARLEKERTKNQIPQICLSLGTSLFIWILLACAHFILHLSEVKSILSTLLLLYSCYFLLSPSVVCQVPLDLFRMRHSICRHMRMISPCFGFDFDFLRTGECVRVSICILYRLDAICELSLKYNASYRKMLFIGFCLNLCSSKVFVDMPQSGHVEYNKKWRKWTEVSCQHTEFSA